MCKKSLFIFLFFTISFNIWAGLTAEQVLGEYWKDPLFGEAATEETYVIDLLNGRVLPDEVDIPVSKKVRVIFLNSGPKPHLIAITRNPQELLSDEKFLKFRADELYHSQQVVVSSASHSHSGQSVDNAESMIKTLPQRPTVFVNSNEQKEILLRFDQVEKLQFFCALEGHGLAHSGIMNIVE